MSWFDWKNHEDQKQSKQGSYIRNDDDLRAAFLRFEPIFQAQDGTPEADERDVLVTLIEVYEQKDDAISSG
ncbi:MAG: hypothetical protein V4751_14585 [Pseudomonadota bacterium]